MVVVSVQPSISCDIYQVEHQKGNFISPSSHLFFLIKKQHFFRSFKSFFEDFRRLLKILRMRSEGCANAFDHFPRKIRRCFHNIPTPSTFSKFHKQYITWVNRKKVSKHLILTPWVFVKKETNYDTTRFGRL